MEFFQLWHGSSGCVSSIRGNCPRHWSTRDLRLAGIDRLATEPTILAQQSDDSQNRRALWEDRGIVSVPTSLSRGAHCAMPQRGASMMIWATSVYPVISTRTEDSEVLYRPTVPSVSASLLFQFGGLLRPHIPAIYNWVGEIQGGYRASINEVRCL